MKPSILVVLMVLLGGLALFVAITSAGAGHGTYLPAKLLFPFTMLLAAPRGPIGFAGIAVAVLQFPVYGFALVAATIGERLKLVAAILIGLHMVAVVAALAVFASGDAFPS